MAKRKPTTGPMFTSVVDRIREKTHSVADGGHMPNIVDFVYGRPYLNMTAQGLGLFPVQEIILKSFYRGSPDNEDLTLTQEEMDKLEELEMTENIDKYNSGNVFRELVLVLGRRSGKNFMSSIIALYEAMRLLEVPGGNPHRFYNISDANPIFIMTVANSADQATLLYNEIKTKLQLSDYFRPKLGPIEADRIYLRTPSDQIRAKELEDAGLADAAPKGSVVILSGHSNSNTLVGKGCFCLLLDEVAKYPSTSGPSSGEAIYNLLTPTTLTFIQDIGIDENGEKIQQLDSKVISISSPRGEEGLLYRLFNQAPQENHRLAFQLPTWDVSPLATKKTIQEQYRGMPPLEFQMEFGAQFGGTAGERFISDKCVDDAFNLGRALNLRQKKVGEAGLLHYIHVDPSSTSHNYALVMLHIEERVKYQELEEGDVSTVPKKERVKLFVVDHLKLWRPTAERGISVSNVDEYLIALARQFRVGLITYDDWNSDASLEKLKKHGIASKKTSFRAGYKQAIYSKLEQLFVNHHIAFPPDAPDSAHLEAELKSLKRIYSPTGFRIRPDTNGQVQTDDLCDALAGAVGAASQDLYSGYPKGGLVNVPLVRSGQMDRPWFVGRGRFSQGQAKTLMKQFGMFSG